MKTTADSEQRRYLESLTVRVQSGHRRSAWLAILAGTAVALSAVCWFAAYAAGVLSFAQLEELPSVERMAQDQLVLEYQPVTTGKVGFRRAESGRETELLDQVAANALRQRQRFEWYWRGVEEGDVVRVTYRRGWSLVTTELPVPPPPPQKLGTAALIGEVVDATSNRPVCGASVKIVGTRLSARTGTGGRFRLADAPSGLVPVEVSATGYGTDPSEREMEAEGETTVRVVLNPGMQAGQMRLVLTWDHEPADLDAHLEGPLPDGSRFHISYQDKGDLRRKQFVNLDVDCRTGSGPETITVLGKVPGTYRYFVHDFTNIRQKENYALARSGAVVKIYHGGQTYAFRANGRSIGNVWHVCDIEVTAGGALVTKIDQYQTQAPPVPIMDVVFLIDLTGSMDGCIEAVKDRCAELATKLAEAGVNARFGVIGFGDAAFCEPMTEAPLTADLAELRRTLRELPRVEGADLVESPLEAVERALQRPFRPHALVQFLLFTDAPCRNPEKIPALAAQLAQRGVAMAIFGHPADKPLYLPLCDDGRRFYRLEAGENGEAGAAAPPGGSSAGPDDASLMATLLRGMTLSIKPPLGATLRAAGTEKGILTGQIVNAVNNKPLEGAEVKIARTGLAATADADGRFRLDGVPVGSAAVEVSARGFSTDRTSKEISKHGECHHRVALSPLISPNQMRLVLTWGDEPADLDLHLEGPLPDGKNFHIFFLNKGTTESRQFVNLDVDDRDGEGPETITVQGLLPGTYRAFVHDYSNRMEKSNLHLARCEAELKVFLGDREFRFKANGKSIGTHWNVCQVDVAATGAATLRSVDQYETKLLKEDGPARDVDIVFLLDTTGSMSPYIEGLKRKCIDFATTVAEGDRRCRLGLIGFGDANLDEPLYVLEPTGNVRHFQDEVRDAPRTGGGDEPESPVDAIERAMDISSLAPLTCFVLITDASCHRAGELAALGQRLKDRHIKVHVVSRPSFKALYRPLYDRAANFHAMDSARFDDLLIGIAKTIKTYVPED